MRAVLVNKSMWEGACEHAGFPVVLHNGAPGDDAELNTGVVAAVWVDQSTMQKVAVKAGLYCVAAGH